MSVRDMIAKMLCSWQDTVEWHDDDALDAPFYHEADRILAALAAAELELVEWQPIATAPKDGTSILAWCKVVPGLGDGPSTPTHEHRIVWCETGEDCFYWMSDRDCGNELFDHWAPLPSGPILCCGSSRAKMRDQMTTQPVQFFAYTESPTPHEGYVQYLQAFRLENGNIELRIRNSAGEINSIEISVDVALALSLKLGVASKLPPQ